MATAKKGAKKSVPKHKGPPKKAAKKAAPKKAVPRKKGPPAKKG